MHECGCEYNLLVTDRWVQPHPLVMQGTLVNPCHNLEFIKQHKHKSIKLRNTIRFWAVVVYKTRDLGSMCSWTLVSVEW